MGPKERFRLVNAKRRSDWVALKARKDLHLDVARRRYSQQRSIGPKPSPSKPSTNQNSFAANSVPSRSPTIQRQIEEDAATAGMSLEERIRRRIRKKFNESPDADTGGDY